MSMCSVLQSHHFVACCRKAMAGNYNEVGSVVSSPGASEDSSDEQLCEYERQRLQNIRENQKVLRSLGKPAKYIIIARLNH